MLPDEERLLEGIETFLQAEDPAFTRQFDLATAQGKLQRRKDTRLFLLVLVGALVFSAGIAAMLFDLVAGALVGGLGCALLICVVQAARRHPTRPAPPTV